MAIIKKQTKKGKTNKKIKKADPSSKKQKKVVGSSENPDYDAYEEEAEELEYEFKNYFNSETQLEDITHETDPEEILQAYSRIIWVFASNHVREDVEIEDLIAEGQVGVCQAIKDYNDPNKKKPKYNFRQACLYKIRSHIFQYCLSNASQIKTPYYIQRGCMHVGQVFKLMTNQSVAEKILKRPGPATEEEITAFIYDEKERLPLKSMRFIKEQITKDASKEEFKQILSGILNHERGSKHAYVKKNLTDVGQILHIKEKLYYTAASNNMKYTRVIDLILSARRGKTELTPQILSLGVFTSPREDVERTLLRRELLERGSKLCGETNFRIFVDNKLYDKTYDEIAKSYNLKKSSVTDIVKACIGLLKKDELFQQMFSDMR